MRILAWWPRSADFSMMFAQHEMDNEPRFQHKKCGEIGGYQSAADVWMLHICRNVNSLTPEGSCNVCLYQN